MNWLEALILGIVQGLTEFLPVSSSGHLELGKVILGVSSERSLIFTVVVHGATVLSTMVVFYKDILNLVKGLFQFKWNEETKYIFKILFSMIPVLFIGLYFSKEVESFFSGDLVFVGSMLIITAILLSLTYIPQKSRRKISFLDALIIGIAQAAAVLPGISRSGSTIATGLIIGNKKENIARFSFLMVLIPIIGANLKDLMDKDLSSKSDVTALPLIIGFLAAFISGLLACKWMINLVKKGKLIYFAIYCLMVGIAAILFGLFQLNMPEQKQAKIFDFQEGETLLINKPLGWTSFNVVSKIRYVIKHNAGIKKIKVGHAGTLDPKASGLLIICTGRNTKKIHLYQDTDKEYIGVFRLGQSSPSLDTETEPDQEFPTNHISEDLIYAVRDKFLGEQEQIPPIYSAIQVKGKRAYNYARNKEELQLKSRKVYIHEFEIEKIKMPELYFRIICSKGTYIRSLARDFGQALSSGAFLSSLCRTRIGNFKLEDAMEIDQFEKIIKKLYDNPP